jgi:hypothetical protein
MLHPAFFEYANNFLSTLQLADGVLAGSVFVTAVGLPEARVPHPRRMHIVGLGLAAHVR